jgi:DNA-binding response OmpR family regulator
MASTVLLVEDDEQMRELIARILAGIDLQVVEAEDGRSAMRLFFEQRPSLVVLDVELPELDGWAVLSRIREVSEVPVLMLTAEQAELNKVRGLREGADDYVTKPFGRQELAARVEALLRRSRPEEASKVFADEFVRIDFADRRVEVLGTEVSLTPTEFRLLSALAQNPGRVLSPSQLLELAWQDDQSDPQRVKIYVGYLRRKFADASVDPVETVRGFGYRYRPRRIAGGSVV